MTDRLGSYASINRTMEQYPDLPNSASNESNRDAANLQRTQGSTNAINYNIIDTSKLNLPKRTLTKDHTETPIQQIGWQLSSRHINPKPSFHKQYDYQKQPYVSQKHYRAMKKAMGDTPYADWDVEDDRIKTIYEEAKKSNKDNSDPDGNSTIASSGCGICAYANLMGISPTESAVKAMEGNHRIYKGGTSKKFFTSNKGKKVADMTAALKEVKKGNYVIYSRGGHFLLLYGFDNLYLYLSDSNDGSSPKMSLRVGSDDSNFAHGYSFEK